METPEASDSCIICNKPNALRCGRCKGASYCSKLCQRADYPIHKLLCASFAGFDITTRPTEEHMRAILFSVDQKKPKLVWLHCKWRGDGGYRDATPFLDGDSGCSNPIEYNPVLGRLLPNIVYLAYRDNFLFDGSARNNSIATITGTSPGNHHDWRGPIIAYGKVGPSPNSAYYRDIDLNDFRHAADYFISYGSDLESYEAPVLQTTLAEIKGVKINCIGDQKMFNKPHFEEIELSTEDTIFTKHDNSDIANRIGLPIFTKRCSPHPLWANAHGSKMYENQDATYLHLCCDPKAERDLSRGVLGWGWASKQWQNRVGSIIVVRQDKKPLSPWHVEALCRYCRYDAGAYLEHSWGGYASDEPMSKDLVLSMICRPTFSICWSKMCNEKDEKGEYINVLSPYHV
ncbi:hypothetical protein HD806DRAFT_548586 [Xylariaceae sp. AK1471]|nr:hypothetical protein HD806DRAFT_548586 [Xylariaceae sp. AK1471]